MAPQVKSKLFLVGGFLMIPVCVFGLLYQQAFIWGVCPPALVVMFFRQALSPYDSLGAADYPELAVGLLYYPLAGWILSRASRAGTLRRTGGYLGILHFAGIVLAVASGDMRNRFWGF